MLPDVAKHTVSQQHDSGSQSKAGMTCLFWNVNKRDCRELLVKLSDEKHVDVVILAENKLDSNKTLDLLRRTVRDSFCEPTCALHRLQVFARDKYLDLREAYAHANGRVTIRVLCHQDTEFLLVAAHLPSKLNWQPADQSAEATALAQQVRDEENRQGHRRTILVGDLNMNPFEDGIVQANGLHAMMTKACVAADSRIVQDRQYPFFYNPMWGFFGDQTDGPPGTHYYRHSGHVSYDWNIFDQVLIRRDVLPWFDGVEIVTKIGDIELTDNNGRPDNRIASDHFPIVFRLAARCDPKK